MKYLAATALFVAAAAAALALVVTGRSLLPIEAELLPIPRIGSGSPQVVVVPATSSGSPRSASRPPAAGTRIDSSPVDDPSSTGEAILASGAPAGVAAAPVPGSAPAQLPVLHGTHSGYVRHGQVVLSLGWVRHAGTSTSVERRLATLSNGSCGAFGPWEPASSTDQLPPGSCAIYRVLVDGAVVYQTPDIVRFDGTRPTVPSLAVSETGPREHAAGSTLYVAAGVDDLKPVAVSASASDPESGLAAMIFASGSASTAVDSAPWEATLTPAAGGISVTAVNAAGGTAISQVDVVVDGDGPSGGFVDYPAKPGPDGTVHVSFGAGTDAGAGLDASSGTLERRSTVSTSDGCGAYGAWGPASADETPAQGRCLQYRYRISDNVGNETIYASGVSLVVADTTAPTTAMVSPVDGTTVSGTITVAAGAADAGSGLRSLTIEARPDHGEWKTLVSGTSAPLAASWDTLSVDPGEYEFRSVAEDRSGNVTESDPVEVEVAADEIAPTAAIVSPSTGDVITGPTLVQAQAGDEGSGLASSTIQVRRVCGAWSDLATSSAGSFSVRWDTTALEPGRYQLRVVATDRRGNITESDRVTVTVAAPPEPEPVPEPPAADDSGGDSAPAAEPDASSGDPAVTPDPPAPAADKSGDGGGAAAAPSAPAAEEEEGSGGETGKAIQSAPADLAAGAGASESSQADPGASPAAAADES